MGSFGLDSRKIEAFANANVRMVGLVHTMLRLILQVVTNSLTIQKWLSLA